MSSTSPPPPQSNEGDSRTPLVNLEALLTDIIVLRHSSAGAPQFLANRLKASVINAGDGRAEYPTQALLVFTPFEETEGKSQDMS
jgi:aspartate carbamoyltransferase catalytic subunit